jgi:hypothetical protein
MFGLLYCGIAAKEFFSMKRTFKVLGAIALLVAVSVLGLACGSSEPATRTQSGQGFQEYNVEGIVAASYPARAADTQGIMHVVYVMDQNGNKIDQKLLFEGPSFKQLYPSYQIKEESRVIFVWTKVADIDGYASAAARLIVLDGHVLTR